jgi:hypothetical protein
MDDDSSEINPATDILKPIERMASKHNKLHSEAQYFLSKVNIVHMV